MILDLQNIHMLFLLFYLFKRDPETGSKVKQFLIADTLGTVDSYLYIYVYNKLVKLEGSEIYSATRERQVDKSSCRVGAMQFMKRALIALHDNPNNDLSEYLRQYGIMSSEVDHKHVNHHFLDHLPPVFDAAEQISNKGGRIEYRN